MSTATRATGRTAASGPRSRAALRGLRRAGPAPPLRRAGACWLVAPATVLVYQSPPTLTAEAAMADGRPGRAATGQRASGRVLPGLAVASRPKTGRTHP